MSKEILMKTSARGLWVHGAAAAGLALSLSACAVTDDAAGTSAAAKVPVYERSDTATGSNLPRRADRPSNVQTVDPEAVKGAARGATRNPGN